MIQTSILSSERSFSSNLKTERLKILNLNMKLRCTWFLSMSSEFFLFIDSKLNAITLQWLLIIWVSVWKICSTFMITNSSWRHSFCWQFSLFFMSKLFMQSLSFMRILHRTISWWAYRDRNIRLTSSTLILSDNILIQTLMFIFHVMRASTWLTLSVMSV